MMKKHFVSLMVVALVAVVSAVGWTSSSNAVATSGSFTDFGQPVPSGGSVTELALGTDGKVYGVTCSTHLFVFNPLDNSIADKGVTPGDCPLALTWGVDGKLYGGGWESTLWSYDLGTSSFASRGQVPGGRRIIGLATGQDGLIYIGTEPEADPNLKGQLFSFDPTTNTFTEIGGVADEVSVGYGLIAGPDGRIFGGTFSSGHFFIYDPSSGILTDKGQPIASQSSVSSLAIGSDGKIYGGVQSSGHLFSYDPSSDTFSDKGQAVARQARVPSLFASGNKIYGGTGNFWSSGLSAHLFEYDITTQSFTDLGIPVQDERNVDSLVVVSGWTVYGGTSFGGHFFSYEPPPPVLTSNFTSGAPSSFFTLTGVGFPASSTATITVNGRTLGTVATNVNGNLTFILSTANADEGSYFVTVSANPAATVHFILDSSEPIRPQDGSGPVFSVPEGIAFTESIFLPIVLR